MVTTLMTYSDRHLDYVERMQFFARAFLGDEDGDGAAAGTEV
jgi:hypothetical protein